jgi:class 3 adenylate cyclase/predicted ATPase
MTFEEILDQAVAMLQRRGRLTYGTLKRQFQLDDAALDDLKNELIEGQRLAVDERGNVLVWTGGTDVSPHITPPGPQSGAPPDTSDAHRTPSGPAPAAPAFPDAERRQLTVLFCDLVDSTALASRLDPEDLRTVVQAYQATCAEIIQRFDGHIAQHLGDGLLVYFGYPQAHEDDVRRAVQSGLGMVEAIRTLNTRLEPAHGVRLAVRLGIHTGLVVVGAIGSGGRQEQLALGETPNIAARLQGLAEPDTVVISEATAHLIHGYFVYQPLGAPALKGVTQPLQVYRVMQASGAQTRLDVVPPRGLTPLVGRDEEVALLERRWDQATARRGQVVLLSGEAGIGKSRLVQVLKEHIAPTPHTRVEWRGSPYHQQSALYPVIDQLQRLVRGGHEVPPDEPLRTLEAALTASGMGLSATVPLLAALLSLPLSDAYAPLTLTPQRQRQHTLETLLAWLRTAAQQQPVLLMVEDLHWVDPSTLELLSLLIEQCAQWRLCLVLTARPEFHPPWSMVAHFTALTLRRFAPAEIERLVTYVVGEKAFPPAVLEEIVRKTDGVPLFVEELTKVVLESVLLQEHEDRYDLTGPLPPLAIPATLHDALRARLDRLATAKLVAQLGAVIGRTFAYDLMQAVAPLDAATLQAALAQLVEAELVAQRGLPPQATYTFKHALIQDTAYQSLLRSTRQQVHQRIAQALETQFPDRVETQPELLAQHYTEGGLAAPAVHYWQRAGERAGQRSAHVEAIAHLTKGLAVLQTLPQTPEHVHDELLLQHTLGVSLMAIKGYAAPEVEQAYARAHALCQQVGETPQLFPVLIGLFLFYVNRPDHQTAHTLGTQCLTLAQRAGDAELLVQAHMALGVTLFLLGQLAQARAHLEQGVALYAPQQPPSLAWRYGHDPGVVCYDYTSRVLWQLGYPDQARQSSHDALTLAQELSHPFSLVYALGSATLLHYYLREAGAVHTQAEATIALSKEHGFPFWLEVGMIRQGWALAAQGQGAEGLAQIHQGLAARRTTAEGIRPQIAAMLAEAHGSAGQAEAGLHVLAEAFTTMVYSGERQYEAELHRLKGELLLQHAVTQPGEAATCFQQALTIARHQQAKSLELRAATSLARLWQRQGKRTEAYELLAPVYGWFTEGFDTADLQEAKMLLEALT